MAIEKNDTIVVERKLEASVETVFAALKAGRLFFNCGAWPTGTTVDVKPGGKYTFSWGHHGSTVGEFTEVVENKRICFTWNVAAEDIKSRVSIDLAKHGSGCLLKLTHEGLTDREWLEAHDGGWNAGLTGFTDELSKGRLRLDREFQGPVELLFDACASLKLLSAVGGVEAGSKVDFRVGGSYLIKLENGKDMHGEFLEITKNKKIVFTWNSGCGVDYPTTVSMEFGPWGDGGKNSYLELIHEGFRDHAATAKHHEGWNTCLEAIYKRMTK